MWILESLIGGGDKPQWTVLRHNGPMFPPEYEYKKIPIVTLREDFYWSQK